MATEYAAHVLKLRLPEQEELKTSGVVARILEGTMPESRIDDLNPEQLRAATTGEGPVLTIAGAGTGKTKTLASRVAWLVSQGIDPGRIMRGIA